MLWNELGALILENEPLFLKLCFLGYHFSTVVVFRAGALQRCRFSVVIPLVLSDNSRSTTLPYPESQWIFHPLVLRLNLTCPQQPCVGIIPRFCRGRNRDSERLINLLKVPEPVSGPVRIYALLWLTQQSILLYYAIVKKKKPVFFFIVVKYTEHKIYLLNVFFLGGGELCHMQDSNSLTRDQSCVPAVEV